MVKKFFDAIFWKRAKKYPETTFSYGGKLTVKYRWFCTRAALYMPDSSIWKLTLTPFFSFHQFHTRNICYNAITNSFHSQKNHTPLVSAYHLSFHWIEKFPKASEIQRHIFSTSISINNVDPWLVTFIRNPFQVKKSGFHCQK